MAPMPLGMPHRMEQTTCIRVLKRLQLSNLRTWKMAIFLLCVFALGVYFNGDWPPVFDEIYGHVSTALKGENDFYKPWPGEKKNAIAVSRNNNNALCASPRISRDKSPPHGLSNEIVAFFMNNYSRFNQSYCASPSAKYLIWRCQKTFWNSDHACGGLGDRLRGIISSFYLSLLTRRCFGVDWEQSTDITKYYEIQFPSYRDMNGYSLSNDFKSFVNIDAWKDERVVISNYAAADWPRITARKDFLQSEFGYIANLSQIQQAYLVEKFLFDSRTAYLEKEYTDLVSRICDDEISIGVQLRLTEHLYFRSENFTRQCFSSEMVRMCRIALQRNPLKKTCAFFLTTDLSANRLPQFLMDLDKDFSNWTKRGQFKLLLSPYYPYHIDSFSLRYFLFGYSSADEYEHYIGTYLDWHMMVSMDMLLISSVSGFSMSAYWFSGAEAFVFDTWGHPANSSNCPLFVRAHRQEIFRVSPGVHCC